MRSNSKRSDQSEVIFRERNNSQTETQIPKIQPNQFERMTEWQIIWRNFHKNRGAVIALIVLILLVLTAIFAEWIAPYDPLEQGHDLLQPPSSKHLFGTDTLGRDMFSRVIFGARISLMVGIGAVFVSLIVGLMFGMSGGYFGRWVDAFVVMGVDSFMAFPGLLLAMVIAALLSPTIPTVMFAVGLGEFTLFARMIRSTVFVEKQKDYILAAKSIGASDYLIIGIHILPNTFPPLIVLTTLTVGSAILMASSLGFLGLGAQPPIPEWGNMTNVGRAYLQIAPWLIWFPGAAIMITVLAANMLGDGLRDALDPRLRR